MIDLPSSSGLAISFIGGGGIPIGVMTLLSALPKSQFWGSAICDGPSDERRQLALTFDDGPDGEFTPRILDTLADHGVRAIFFVIGRNVERFPEVTRRIAAEGHILGNHTWDHDHHGYLRGPCYWDHQLARTDVAIEQIIGQRPAFFRPPMGLRTGHVMRAAAKRGLTVVTWTRRGMDGIAITAERVESRLGPLAQPGEIIVLHDGIEPNSRRSPAATCAALGPILRQWKTRNLSPVRLDQWLDRSAYAAVSSANS